MKKKAAFMFPILMLWSLWACNIPTTSDTKLKTVHLHIKGTVTDTRNEPINGAKVMLGTPVVSIESAATTDDKGQYSMIYNVDYYFDPPALRLIAEAEGYKKSEKNPMLTEEWQIIDFQLLRD